MFERARTGELRLDSVEFAADIRVSNRCLIDFQKIDQIVSALKNCVKFNYRLGKINFYSRMLSLIFAINFASFDWFSTFFMHNHGRPVHWQFFYVFKTTWLCRFSDHQQFSHIFTGHTSATQDPGITTKYPKLNVQGGMSKTIRCPKPNVQNY